VVVFRVESRCLAFEAEAQPELPVGDPFRKRDDLLVVVRAEIAHGLPGLGDARGRDVAGDAIAMGGHEPVDELGQSLWCGIDGQTST